jgi:rSAM/selenodomain-associated transferase 1
VTAAVRPLPDVAEVVGLVVAKAPVPGAVKTRLAATVGPTAAADLAASALLDTLDAVEAAFGRGHCHLSLAGDLRGAARGAELRRRLAGWTVHRQRGRGLGERLARAHRDVASSPGRAVVQVGMDTPQVEPEALAAVATQLEGGDHDAVVGPAEDGGWWVLGLRDPLDARVLSRVPMSRSDTCAATVSALEAVGARVGLTGLLRDVDTATDATLVAEHHSGRFADAWHALVGGRRP